MSDASSRLLRPPRVAARLRRRVWPQLRRQLLNVLAVEALLAPPALRWMRRRLLLRSPQLLGQQKLGLLLRRCLMRRHLRPSIGHLSFA